ncbi:MAG: hypothetical protein WAM14_12820 [Candidatus Nitrosopolaris sp.]
MDEKNLKHLFIQYINTGHNDGNNFLSINPQDPDIEIRIKDEGYYRNFDLIIAVIKKRHSSQVESNWISSGDTYQNMIMRSCQLIQFAQKERTRIDWITFYPVELKSDNDVLDGRLTNQVLNAILTFGKSILVLDKEHSKRLKSKGVLSLIPATVIGYTVRSDHFEVLSVLDRFINDGIFSIEKRKLTKMLLDNEINPTSSIFNCFLNFQRIYQKIIFSHLNDQHVGLMKEEINFILKLADIKPLTTRKLVRSLIKETANNKITDYF